MSLADANRKYFDTMSDLYDRKPWFAKVNQRVTDELRSRLDWLGVPLVNTGSSSDVQEARLLDYACGTGLMSRLYGPYVTTTLGIDVSPNMVATYNARAQATGLTTSTITGVIGDLFATPQPGEFSGPEYYNFDLATVGFGFHHFEDVIHAASCLRERLRPGGVLVITEFLEGGDLALDENGNPLPDTAGGHDHHGHGHHHGHDHDHDHGHGHHHPDPAQADGPHTPTLHKNKNSALVSPQFTIEEIKKFFAEAGFVDLDVVVMDEKVYMEFAGRKMWRTVLFAKGRRPMEDEVKGDNSEL
ncbi:S-adenosyl-L-methionine-dependent methyltransferase [Pleomassaria siparia CBS 279.74]|uniref:S-adenosyl-L-methionine-dependent methyltransferase n=1 Tax=Pleomassaria siparia CBS 279.74 TaxID=1314801 RepID=A0A6G1KIP8_9PLEO|nr:S-adenosyl-L-methionine-dependent methyltransferase [Pleomassaria siparia CBS 279.74]